MTDWQVSGFEEVRELGRGGQGRVVLAKHATRGTAVAIKYLAAGADTGAQERLREEARMLGQVDNPHVAKLFRLVESDDGIAIIMEAVDGVSFKEILKRYEKLEPEAALTVLKGSLLGLAAAHAVGVVHRDYKPANVVVPADGQSKLIDFGIAAQEGSSSPAGTPIYMAPEQWRGEAASPATDVYAATCVFYESVTGHRPFELSGSTELRQSHLTAPVPVEDVPEALRPLITRGMAKDAAERPVGAAAFVGELEEIAQRTYGPEWEMRGVRALAGTALAMAALFPLAAAGLAPAATAAAAGTAAGTTAAASSGGVISAIGIKATVVIAGTAVVGGTAGGYGVYQATKPAPKHPIAATAAAPTPPGKPIKVGTISIAVPASWKMQRIDEWIGTDKNFKQHTRPGDSYYVATAGGSCLPKGYRVNPANADVCQGFFVLGPSFLTESGAGGYTAQPYDPEDTYASRFNMDEGMSCPRHESLRAAGVANGAKTTVQKLAPVGSHKANFREWLVPCWTRAKTAHDIEGYGPTARTSTTYTERLWYLPDSKIVIVDLWNTPRLDKILEQATWL